MASKAPAKRRGEVPPTIYQRIRGFIESFFRKKEPKGTPVGGIVPRITNMMRNNFRGIIGFLVPALILPWYAQKGVHSKTVSLMWMWMFWFLLWQPVCIPVTGLIPVFLLPMSGAMSTGNTCQCYMTENTVLFILSAMLILLLNNSGVDRRIALWFICSGDACQFSAKRMIFKVSSAAFFLGMFSSRLISSSIIIQYVAPVLMNLQATAGQNSEEPNFDEIRYIIVNAIQTASGIGSVAILHSSTATVLFRTIWAESPPPGKEYPDIFNYLQYSAFAFPVAFFMFIINFCYHMFLINRCIGKPMTSASMSSMRRTLLKHQADLPHRTTLHEDLSIISLIVMLMMFFFRWNKWTDIWGNFRMHPEHPQIPKIRDATVAAIFVVALHTIPKSYTFLKFVEAEKKSQCPPLKAESAILWWRFVDKNINYGYFFTFGSSVALVVAARETGLAPIIAEHFGTTWTKYQWNQSILFVCFTAALLANMTTAVAACGIFLPIVMCMSHGSPKEVALSANEPWPTKVYCGALGVGIASSFGFCFPFMYTPAYFCHTVGKVPIKKMVKYSIVSVILCVLILWLALITWAPYLFDPKNVGISPIDAPGAAGATTTPKTDAALPKP